MKSLIDAVVQDMGKQPGTTPPIAEDAFRRMQDRFSKPPVPLMSQEEYDALPPAEKSILICNMPGCGKVVSTHGMLCVEHREQLHGPWQPEAQS